MKLEDIMSKNIITIDENSTLNEVAKVFKDFDIGFLPVTNGNKITGVITDRDIVVKVLANNDTDIKKYINNHIISTNIKSSINDILNIMKENKIKRVIIEDNNLVQGIISISDILNYNDDLLINTFKSIYKVEKHRTSPEANVKEFYL